MSPKDITGVIYKGETHTKEAREATMMPTTSINPVRCPIDGFECTNKCQQGYEGQGATFCLRWIELQREEGRKELEADKQNPSKNGNASSTTNHKP